MKQKSFIEKNLVVICLLVILIAVVAVFATTQERVIDPTLGTLEADATAAPAAEATEAPEAQTEETEEAPKQSANAYLVVSVAGQMYEPIPLTGDARYTVTRGDMVNTIQVTADSITMHESSCDNQDCVIQGTVSLENYKKRVLQNMIICLPNEVVLELYTAEELTALLLDMVGYTGEETNE